MAGFHIPKKKQADREAISLVVAVVDVRVAAVEVQVVGVAAIVLRARPIVAVGTHIVVPY